MSRVLWILTIAYAAFLATMTHLPPRKLPETGVNDKLEHFGAYGLLAGAVFCAAWASWPRHAWRATWVALVAALAFGVLDELTQAIPGVGRSCELNDWLADAAGAGIAVVVMTCVRVVVARAAPTRSPSGSLEARPAGRG
ncbi:MAG: VanZ family protein [Phycisphaerae bacterium]|nr:VanZ family protein [Tepidisphaeraceae bacterium]